MERGSKRSNTFSLTSSLIPHIPSTEIAPNAYSLTKRDLLPFTKRAWKLTLRSKAKFRCISVDPEPKETEMPLIFPNRRRFLSYGAALTAAKAGLWSVPAQAQSVQPTRSMRGGSNNYRPGAPIVERIGGGGFWMSGSVRRVGDGAPLAGQRIQIWAHTTEGHERDQRSHGATLTDADGVFRLEMPQIVPAFGQAHGHLAYDSGDFKTVFLRPVMASSRDTTLEAHFVLEPA